MIQWMDPLQTLIAAVLNCFEMRLAKSLYSEQVANLVSMIMEAERVYGNALGDRKYSTLHSENSLSLYLFLFCLTLHWTHGYSGLFE